MLEDHSFLPEATKPIQTGHSPAKGSGELPLSEVWGGGESGSPFPLTGSHWLPPALPSMQLLILPSVSALVMVAVSGLLHSSLVSWVLFLDSLSLSEKTLISQLGSRKAPYGHFTAVLDGERPGDSPVQAFYKSI